MWGGGGDSACAVCPGGSPSICALWASGGQAMLLILELEFDGYIAPHARHPRPGHL